jgi:hypothetical protein
MTHGFCLKKSENFIFLSNHNNSLVGLEDYLLHQFNKYMFFYQYALLKRPDKWFMTGKIMLPIYRSGPAKMHSGQTGVQIFIFLACGLFNKGFCHPGDDWGVCPVWSHDVGAGCLPGLESWRLYIGQLMILFLFIFSTFSWQERK